MNGGPTRITRDCKRNGRTTQFAALDAKSGLVIGEYLPRDRAKKFLRFLCRIDRMVREPRKVHLVLDNYATRDNACGQNLPGQTPRFKLYFTPTSAFR